VPRLARKLDINQEDVNKLQEYLDRRLMNVWEWLLKVMDSTEAQLRFGGSLTSTGDHVRTRPATSTLTTGRTLESRGARERDDAVAARREFLSYSLSLMRAHNAEHFDSLPVIDVSSFKHVAYVFDSLIYFLRSGSDTTANVNSTGSTEGTDYENVVVHDPEEPDDMSYSAVPSGLTNVEIGDFDDEADSVNTTTAKTVGRRHGFFQRSESTMCLGCPPPDPFQVFF
jgi:E3 ubiquitin-protein ligase EDD1